MFLEFKFSGVQTIDGQTDFHWPTNPWGTSTQCQTLSLLTIIWNTKSIEHRHPHRMACRMNRSMTKCRRCILGKSVPDGRKMVSNYEIEKQLAVRQPHSD